MGRPKKKVYGRSVIQDIKATAVQMAKIFNDSFKTAPKSKWVFSGRHGKFSKRAVKE